MNNEAKLIIGLLGVSALSLVVISASYIDDNIRNRQKSETSKRFKDLLDKAYLENDNLKKKLREFQK